MDSKWSSSKWSAVPRPGLQRGAGCSPGCEPRFIYTAEAVLHLVKGNLGPGLFSLPLQFAIAGTLVGLSTLAVVAAQGLYCMWLLVHTQQQAESCRAWWLHEQGPPTPVVKSSPRSPFGLPSPPPRPRFSGPLTFDELGRLALGRCGQWTVQFCVLSLQLGICSVFISLVAENLLQPLPGGFTLGLTREEAVLLAYVPCLVLSLLPDLSNLTPLSAFGTAAMLMVLLSVIATALQQLIALPFAPHASFSGVEFPAGDDAAAPAAMAVAPFAATPAAAPGVLGISSCAAASFYAFEGMSIVLPIGNALAPHSAGDYAPLVVKSMGSVAVLFALVACLTALAFPAIDSSSVTAYLAHRYSGSPG